MSEEAVLAVLAFMALTCIGLAFTVPLVIYH